MPRMLGARLAAFVWLIAALAAARNGVAEGGEEWSRFRGPNGSGVTESGGLPVEFGPEINVSWRAEVPFGRSSPVVGTRRIFLTGIDGEKLVLVALDRESGAVAWRRELDRVRRAEIYHGTDSSTSTPATDGENVYAFFHEAGLVSFDGDGRERWRRPLGPFRNHYGIAASPILAGSRLILLCDQAVGSFLLALDKDTGEELWRSERPGRLEAWTTPVLLPDGLVLVAGSRWIDAYDPETGDARWSLGGLGTGPIASPVVAGDRLFLAYIDMASEAPPSFAQLTKEHDENGDGELSQAELADTWMKNHFPWVNVDGEGGISWADWKAHVGEVVNDSWGLFAVRLPEPGGKPEIQWNHRKNVPYIPSPLAYQGVVYTVHEGIVSSLDPASGALLKRGRLGDGSPQVYASPVAADGKLFVATLDGRVAVVAAGTRWEVLALNDLGERIFATPAIADGRLLVRSGSSLHAFAAPPAATDEATSGR